MGEGAQLVSQRRNLERRHLIFYLKVQDVKEDKLLGFLVDMSPGGFMLMSDEPLPEGKQFQVRFLLPDHGQYGIPFEVGATCMWCRQGPNLNIFDSGFRMDEPAEKVRESLKLVLEELGFGRH